MPSPIDALQGVVNANQALPNVVTAGQPGPEHFRALKAAGVEVVLDTRAPSEPRGFDEAALLKELGLEYVVVPITDQTLTDETLDRITETMRANARRQILVHCASGNRIGGALVPYLMLDQGFTEDDATMAALRIGLRGAHLLQWGIDYVRAREETP
ncbi:MAG: hypothetical protein OEW44_08365 [Gemmatimonadota bacterium]|jgi:protein tyrosine phosphatase (PTP) superfamily phosphohydrolase (DUF442 family)|nr:hypothetical protein [Gemmatimonadota bacterium]